MKIGGQRAKVGAHVALIGAATRKVSGSCDRIFSTIRGPEFGGGGRSIARQRENVSQGLQVRNRIPAVTHSAAAAMATSAAQMRYKRAKWRASK